MTACHSTRGWGRGGSASVSLPDPPPASFPRGFTFVRKRQVTGKQVASRAGLGETPGSGGHTSTAGCPGEVWLRLFLPGGVLSSLLFFLSSLDSLRFPKPPGPACSLVLTSAPTSPRTPRAIRTLQTTPAQPRAQKGSPRPGSASSYLSPEGPTGSP